MADRPQGLGDAMASLGTAITAPVKLAYAGFIALAIWGNLNVTLCPFLLVTLAFIVIQVWHDDYLRIRLNNWAEVRGAEERRKEGFSRIYDDLRSSAEKSN